MKLKTLRQMMYNCVNYTHPGNSYVLEKLWALALTKRKKKKKNKENDVQFNQ